MPMTGARPRQNYRLTGSRRSVCGDGPGARRRLQHALGAAAPADPAVDRGAAHQGHRGDRHHHDWSGGFPRLIQIAFGLSIAIAASSCFLVVLLIRRRSADLMAEIASTRSIASVGTPAQKPQAPALPALARQLPAMPGRILVRRAIKAAEHFGTTPDALVSARRTQPLARRRQLAMYVAHKMTGRSLVFIGRKIGDGVAVEGRLDAGGAEMMAAVGTIMARLQVTAGAALAAMLFVVAFIAAAARIAPAGHFGLWLSERLSHRRGHR
jgi:hypothetical protein